MNARIRFHGRLRVQRVFNFIALLRDREKVGISHNIKWIARFLRVYTAVYRSIVVPVCNSEQHD